MEKHKTTLNIVAQLSSENLTEGLPAIPSTTWGPLPFYTPPADGLGTPARGTPSNKARNGKHTLAIGSGGAPSPRTTAAGHQDCSRSTTQLATHTAASGTPPTPAAAAALAHKCSGSGHGAYEPSIGSSSRRDNVHLRSAH